MKMVIRTRRQVWFLTVSVTVIALAVAEILNFAFYPAAVLPYALPGTAIMVILIVVPICLFGGLQMRENANLSIRLQLLLTRDAMTHLHTRDYFFEAFRQNPSATGVILMVDVDRFKRVNDSHGHLVGDEVIKAVAAVLRREARGDDLVARFGGEEFMLFLPDTTMAQGYEMAERLRVCVAETSVAAGVEQVRVTVSIGGALKHRAIDTQTALQQADKALYLAKDRGRNCTIFANTPKISPAETV